ncbi:hypothetical protein CXF72_05325 [Psychromonas sp. MB-3u-54]|nr:hypothetical protein CXF72_05325 [Psychromonas sp. MB-3u-54]
MVNPEQINHYKAGSALHITQCPVLSGQFTVLNDLSVNLGKVIPQCPSTKKTSASKKKSCLKLFLLPFSGCDFLSKVACFCDYLTVKKCLVEKLIKRYSKKKAYYVILSAALLILWKE